MKKKDFKELESKFHRVKRLTQAIEGYQRFLSFVKRSSRSKRTEFSVSAYSRKANRCYGSYSVNVHMGTDLVESVLVPSVKKELERLRQEFKSLEV